MTGGVDWAKYAPAGGAEPELVSPALYLEIERGILEATAEVGALSASAAALSVVVANADANGLGLSELIVMVVRLHQLLPPREAPAEAGPAGGGVMQ